MCEVCHNWRTSLFFEILCFFTNDDYVLDMIRLGNTK